MNKLIQLASAALAAVAFVGCVSRPEARPPVVTTEVKIVSMFSNAKIEISNADNLAETVKVIEDDQSTVFVSVRHRDGEYVGLHADVWTASTKEFLGYIDYLRRGKEHTWILRPSDLKNHSRAN